MTITVSSGTQWAFLSTLITFCVTTLSATAVAQDQSIPVSDAECTTLYSDTTLNEENVAMRIACHQLSVERIDWLVKQLQGGRSSLTSQMPQDDPQLLEYKQKLIDNQKIVERLEKRTTDLVNLSDALRAQRNEYRKRLFTIIEKTESNKHSRQLDDRIFENFSQSYVSLSDKNAELHRLLDEQNQNLLSNQSEIDNQQTVIQQLKDDLSSSTEKLEAANQSGLKVSEDLQQSKAQLALSVQQQTELMQQIDNTREQLTASDANNAELQLKFEKIAEQNEKLHSELDETENQLADSLEQQRRMRDQLGNAAIQSDELKTRLQTQEQSFGALKLESDTTISELKDRLTTRDRRIADFHRQQTQTNNQLATQIESSTAEVASLQESASNNKQTIKQLTATTNLLEDELKTTLNKLNRESEARITAEKLRTDLAKNSDATIKRLKSQSLEDNKNIARLEEQLAQLNSRYQEASKKISQLDKVQQSNESLGSELSVTRAQLEEQISNNALLNSKLEESNSANTGIELKLAQTEATNTTLEDTLQEKTEQLKAKQAQLANLESELSASEVERQELAKQVAFLEADLNNLNDLLQQSQDSVAASLEQMRKELRASDERLADRKSALTALLDEKNANAEALARLENESSLLTESIKSKLMTAGLTNAKIELQSNQTIAISVGSSTLFRPGSSQLTKEGTSVLETVGNSIANVENRKIVVEGHSDNTPLGTKLEKLFVDNWGLSMARAVSTANFLSRNTGIAANLLSVSGLGDTDPVADNGTVEGRQQNRRVEILLVGSN